MNNGQHSRKWITDGFLDSFKVQMLAFLENTSLCWYSVVFEAVLGFRIRSRIRIRWFLMLMGLPDPDPDPLVTSTDPDPAPDPTLDQALDQTKIVRKILISSVL